MPLIDQLKADHEEFRRLGRAIEALLRAPEGAATGPAVAGLVEAFRARLETHSKLEDEALYPAVRNVMSRSALLNDVYMRHLDAEHKAIDGHLNRLIEMVDGGRLSRGWGQTFAIFSVGLRSHIQREEDELFPEAERLLGAAFGSPSV